MYNIIDAQQKSFENWLNNDEPHNDRDCPYSLPEYNFAWWAWQASKSNQGIPVAWYDNSLKCFYTYSEDVEKAMQTRNNISPLFTSSPDLVAKVTELNNKIGELTAKLSRVTEEFSDIKQCYEDGGRMKLLVLIPLGKILKLDKALHDDVIGV